MEEKILIAGFGGQGILVSGLILAYAGMYDGFNVSSIPSYGAEQRGGTANCMVKISENSIANPMFNFPTIEVIFNQPSFDKFFKKLSKNGLFIYNSALVELNGVRNDIDEIPIDTDRYLKKYENPRILNIIMIAQLAKNQNFLEKKSIEKAIKTVFSKKSNGIIEQNLNVFNDIIAS